MLQCLAMATITLEIPDNLAKAVEDSLNELPDILETGLSMKDPISIQAYQEAFSLLEQELSHEAIIDFKFSAKVRSGLRTLLSKNNDGLLTPAEKAELDRLVNLERRIKLIKAKAFAKKTTKI